MNNNLVLPVNQKTSNIKLGNRKLSTVTDMCFDAVSISLGSIVSRDVVRKQCDSNSRKVYYISKHSK